MVIPLCGRECRDDECWLGIITIGGTLDDAPANDGDMPDWPFITVGIGPNIGRSSFPAVR